MSRDVFSTAEIADLAGMHPDHPSAPWYLAYRRLRAKKIQPSRTETSSANGGSATTSLVGAIAKQSRPLPSSPRHYTREQWNRVSPEQVRWETSAQQKAWKLLLSVPSPMTRGRIARALVVDNSYAYRWQQFFAAAGALVKTGDGVYTWAWLASEESAGK